MDGNSADVYLKDDTVHIKFIPSSLDILAIEDVKVPSTSIGVITMTSEKNVKYQPNLI